LLSGSHRAAAGRAPSRSGDIRARPAAARYLLDSNGIALRHFARESGFDFLSSFGVLYFDDLIVTEYCIDDDCIFD